MLAEENQGEAASASTLIPAIWIDLTDLLAYFAHHNQATGIQRVCLETYLRITTNASEYGVRFCSLDLGSEQLVEIPRAEAVRFLTSAVKLEVPGTSRRPRILSVSTRSPARGARGIGNKFATLGAALAVFLPPRLRSPFSIIVQSLVAIVSALGAIAIEPFRWINRIAPLFVLPAAQALRGLVQPADVSTSRRRVAELSAGDTVVNLGAPWSVPYYWPIIHHLRKQKGFNVITLIYDLIPLLRPEWFPADARQAFRNHVTTALEECEALFVLSEYTHQDLVSWASQNQLALPPLAVFKLGRFRNEVAGPVDDFLLPTEIARDFVLCVGTIDIRKNQRLLFDVWAELQRRVGDAQTPQLVLAGQLGHLRADLMELLANSNALGGKIVVVPNASDVVLDRLYSRCLFTVFPSLYEGWGLPVGESLAYSKYCVASRLTSVPEVGGDLVDYFDPQDFHDAYRAIERPILDREFLEARTRQVVDAPRLDWNVAAEENRQSLYRLMREREQRRSSKP